MFRTVPSRDLFETMEIRKVAVLGSNSFSGADFIDLLLERGDFTVLGVSRSPEKGPLFLSYLRHGRRDFHFVQADLNKDTERLQQSLDDFQPSWIVNFAAQSEVAPSWQYPEQWYQTNCVALARLVRFLCDRKWLDRYLHISSPEAYGTCIGPVTEATPDNPSTPYAASKSAADALLGVYRRQFGLPVLWVRATNVYGARQQLFKIIPRSIIYMKLGRIIELHGGGRAVKSYIHVRDVSRGQLVALERGRIGERYHISPDDGVCVREVVSRLAGKLGLRLAEVSADVCERLGQDAAYVINSDKLRGETNWRPEIPLDRGLGEVVEWIGENWDQIRTSGLEYVHQP